MIVAGIGIVAVPVIVSIAMPVLMDMIGMVMMVVVVTEIVAVVMAMVPMPAPGIGPAFGIEGGLDRRHRPPQPGRHFGDHMILPDAQSAAIVSRDQLRRKVAVAQMPGDAHQRGHRRRTNFQ